MHAGITESACLGLSYHSVVVESECAARELSCVRVGNEAQSTRQSTLDYVAAYNTTEATVAHHPSRIVTQTCENKLGQHIRVELHES